MRRTEYDIIELACTMFFNVKVENKMEEMFYELANAFSIPVISDIIELGVTIYGRRLVLCQRDCVLCLHRNHSSFVE